ncbi:WD40 repeat domain-containing protein [Streptomyces sp. S1]|uniref:WD40 repeat domain-containing protein n=1 Tax=Streptomyces sp. S1 TaxID=718288 RepID=UPI003D7329CC
MRVLVLVVACLVAVGLGVGVSRWQSDDPPPTGGKDDGRASEHVGYTLTEVRIPENLGGVTATAALDGERVLVGTGFGNVYSLDLSEGGKGALRRITALVGEVRSIEVSADGGSIAVLNRAPGLRYPGEDTLRVMDPSAPAVVKVVDGGRPAGGPVTDFPLDGSHGKGALSPDGRLFVNGSFDLTLLDIATGERRLLERGPLKDGRRTGYEDWAFTANGLVRAISEQGVDTWDVRSGERVGETVECGCNSYRVSLTEDGDFAAVATAEGRSVVLDLTAGRPLADKTVTRGEEIPGSAVVGGGKRVAVAAAERLVVWDVEHRRTLWSHTFPGYRPTDVRAVPNSGSFLVSVVEDPEAGDRRTAPANSSPLATKWWLATPAP